MTLSPDPMFPMSRCYVLKLRSDPTPASDLPAGRLENLRSGEQFEFRDAKELLECLTTDLNAQHQEER